MDQPEPGPATWIGSKYNFPMQEQKFRKNRSSQNLIINTDRNQNFTQASKRKKDKCRLGR